MATTDTLARDTRRRLRAATVGAAGKAARAFETATHTAPADIVGMARDLVAPTPHPLSDPPPGSRLKAVPGDPGEPILGGVRSLSGDRASWGMEQHRRFGNLWWTMVIGRRFVNVTGGDATKQVLINRDNEFSQDGWVELIGHFFGGGLMLRSFGEHLDHRRIMQSAFTKSQLAGYLAGMDERIQQDVAEWEDGTHLMYRKLKDLGLRVATDVFLGMELPPSRRQEVLASFHAQARAPLAAIRMDLPLTQWGAGRSGYDHIQRFFRDAIEDKRANPGPDLFSAMVHAEDDDGEVFTDQQLVEHMNFLWFAAHDTTNLAMTMMSWAFAAHPEWQDRAREESLAVGDGPLTADDLEKLPAIDLVMKEAMRLWPPVPAALRRAEVETSIDGHHIPKGTWLHVFPVVTHRMEEYWTDPDTFDPTRFEEGREEHKAHSHCYTPFGAGAHKCLGFAFAQMEAAAVFHRLLRTHRLELVEEGYEPPMTWTGLPEPTDELPLRVTRL